MGKKIGIFGGAFNPFHKGHLDALMSVCSQTDLDEVKVIPCHQAVDKKISKDSPSSFQRLEMLQEELKDLQPQVIVDDIEIKRGGKSYTIDTINNFQMEAPEHTYYLIIGVDQFEVFDTWKDYKSILEKVNLIVTSRPGWSLEESFIEPPEGLKEYIMSTESNKAWSCSRLILKTSREINFIDLEKNIDLSSSLIRRLTRSGLSISDFVSNFSENYIQKGDFYKEKIFTALSEKALAEIPKAISEHFYKDSSMTALGFDLRDKVNYHVEFAFVVTTTSSTAAQSEKEKIQAILKDRFKLSPIGSEDSDDWSVLDYGYIMIHFMSEQAVQAYDILDFFGQEALMSQESFSNQE